MQRSNAILKVNTQLADALRESFTETERLLHLFAEFSTKSSKTDIQENADSQEKMLCTYEDMVTDITSAADPMAAFHSEDNQTALVDIHATMLSTYGKQQYTNGHMTQSLVTLRSQKAWALQIEEAKDKVKSIIEVNQKTIQ